MHAKIYETEFTRQTRVFFPWGLSQIFCANWSLQRIPFEIRLPFRGQNETHISYTTCCSMNLFYHSGYLCCYKICLAGCFHMINSGKNPSGSQYRTGQDISNTITRQTRVLFPFLGPADTIRNSALYRGQKTQISYTTCCSMILFYQN